MSTDRIENYSAGNIELWPRREFAQTAGIVTGVVVFAAVVGAGLFYLSSREPTQPTPPAPKPAFVAKAPALRPAP